MQKYRSLFVIIVLVAAAVAAVYFAVRPKPIAAEIATITRATLETGIEAEAKTRVHDAYTVAAPVAGRVGRISLREGDTVRAGQLVAAIDALPQTSAVRQALAQLDEIRAQERGVETLRLKNEFIIQARSRETAAKFAYEQAVRDRKRAESLAATGDIPRSQLEAAQLLERSRSEDLTAARAAVAEAQAKQTDPSYLLNVYRARAVAIEAQLRTLEDQAARTEIRAPITGKVLRVLQKSEASVSAGAALLQIADVNNLEIVADVLSQDAVEIQPGDPIIIERGAGSAKVTGRVTRIEPSAHTKVSALGVEEQRADVVGRFDSLPRAVGDQYRLDVRIITWRGPALRIPVGALFRCGEAWCAFKVQDGHAKHVQVTLGHRGADMAEVTSGLSSGDRVVVHPSDRVADGTELAAREP